MRLTGARGVRTLRTFGGKYQTLPITPSRERVSVNRVKSAQTAQPSIHAGFQPPAGRHCQNPPPAYANLLTSNHHRQGVSK